MKLTIKNGLYKSGIAYKWYLNGQLHNEDGPAVRNSLRETEWWLNGVRHREDGPAVEYMNGYKEWWLNGEELTEQEFDQWLMKRNLNRRLQDKFTFRAKEEIRKI